MHLLLCDDKVIKAFPVVKLPCLCIFKFRFLTCTAPLGFETHDVQERVDCDWLKVFPKTQFADWMVIREVLL